MEETNVFGTKGKRIKLLDEDIFEYIYIYEYSVRDFLKLLEDGHTEFNFCKVNHGEIGDKSSALSRLLTAYISYYISNKGNVSDLSGVANEE